MLLILLFVVISECSGFNLDVENALVFKNPAGSDSYFGYSVALYPAGESSVLLVGAPRANSSRPADVRVVEPGAVYRCRIGDGECAEWLVDGLLKIRSFEEKDHAWLGGSISVQNSSRPKVVVCAPGWKKKNSDNLFMNGMCYSTVVNDSSVFDKADAQSHFPVTLSQKTTEINRGYVFYYGMAQVGFSSHVTPEKGDLILGAPGVLHWAGSIVMINHTVRGNSYASQTPNILYDHKNFEISDYNGYSVTSGHFFLPSKRLYAAGAPRSLESLGKVIIFDFPTENKKSLSISLTLKGDQIGEYFGASLAACDINSDGRDDLVVGAPQWAADVDEGRVHVFISEGFTEFRRHHINGTAKFGRFGTSVVCLGDLDYDGYADVAVGAPYEDGQGAVYVYSGSSEGLGLSQKISARDFGAEPQGFGFSISEPRDVDGNGYGDLAVGAYLSGHSVLIKAKPVVKLELSLSKSENFKLTENLTSFQISACAVYDGIHAPDSYEIIERIDVDVVHKRGYANIEELHVNLMRGIQHCTSVNISLNKNVQNVIDPLYIQLQMYAHEDSICKSCPAVSPKTSKTRDTLELYYILSDCGADNLCTCDLRVELDSNLDNNTYVIGSQLIVDVKINISNTFEPACKTRAHFYVPKPIALAKLPPKCTEKAENHETLKIVCDIGNPLSKSEIILLQLDLDRIQYSDKYKDIKVNITTRRQKSSPLSGAKSLRINLNIDTNLTIKGKSYNVTYNMSNPDLGKDNKEAQSRNLIINHLYEISNLGVTPVAKTNLIINIPTHLNDSEIAKVTMVKVLLNKNVISCKNNSIQKELNPVKNSIMAQEKILYLYSSNLTCHRILCNVGPLVNNQSEAQVIVTVDLKLLNAAGVIESKDDIIFVTNGSVSTVEPNNALETKKSVQVSTKILISREKVEIVNWTSYGISGALGLLILMIISFILKTFGFFNRKRVQDEER